jgi:hypothetical protein
VRGCLAQQQQRADFSSTPANQARDKRNKKDPKIGMHCCSVAISKYGWNAD